MYFSPLLLWEMPLQCHKGYQNSAIPCDESTVLCTVVIWWAKMQEKRISNLSDAAKPPPSMACVGSGNTACCLGCGFLISSTHIPTQLQAQLWVWKKSMAPPSRIFFPVDIIPHLHVTHLNKTCKNTWFSRADLTTVMFEAGMRKPMADLASS